MNEYQWLINQRAIAKRANWAQLSGERDRYVPFDEWTHFEHGIADPRSVPRNERRKLYLEYQDAMVRMHFLEWDSASFWDLPSFLNLFGR